MSKNNEYKYLRFKNHEKNKKKWYVDIFDNDDDEWIGCIEIEKNEKDYDFDFDLVLNKREQIMDIEKFIMNWGIKKQGSGKQGSEIGSDLRGTRERGSRRLTPGD